MTAFSIITCAILYFNIENILSVLDIDEQLSQSTFSYMSVIIIFLPFVMVGITVDYFVRADENPNLSFVALLSSAVLNIVLDYIFIVKLDYGLSGAAWATGLSYMIVIFILLPHFFLKNTTLRLIKPSGSFSVILTALKNGISEFINESSAGITVMIFNFFMIQYLGTEGVASYTIITYFIMVSIMISFAISDGIQPIVARHYGAKEFTRIKIFLKLASSTILLFSIALVVFVLTTPEHLVDIFLNEQASEAKSITVEFLSYTWMAFLFIGLNILITSYLTAIHQPFASATISLARSLIFPILFVSVLSFYFGIVGVYMALPCSEIFTFIVAVYFFRKYAL